MILYKYYINENIYLSFEKLSCGVYSLDMCDERQRYYSTLPDLFDEYNVKIKSETEGDEELSRCDCFGYIFSTADSIKIFVNDIEAIDIPSSALLEVPNAKINYDLIKTCRF